MPGMQRPYQNQADGDSSDSYSGDRSRTTRKNADKDCQCESKTPRYIARHNAYMWAGIPLDGAGYVQIPWRNLNLPKGISRSSREYGQTIRDLGSPQMGHYDPVSKAMVTEHPLGHPDMIGDGHPEHHKCGHFHAINAEGQEIIFEYFPNMR